MLKFEKTGWRCRVNVLCVEPNDCEENNEASNQNFYGKYIVSICLFSSKCLSWEKYGDFTIMVKSEERGMAVMAFANASLLLLSGCGRGAEE